MTASSPTTTSPTSLNADALPALPDEVVTRALVRDVVLPRTVGGDPGTLALITLDNGRDHTRPTTFGPAGLRSLTRRSTRSPPRSLLARSVPWPSPASRSSSSPGPT